MKGRIDDFRFSIDDFGSWQPHKGQLEFLQTDAKIKVLACGRRWGKTDACAAAIVKSMLAAPLTVSRKPLAEGTGEAGPRKHIILAPTQDQANLLFERVVEMLEERGEGLRVKGEGTEEAKSEGLRAKGIRVRRTPYPRLDFNGHRVVARSGSMGRALRGNEATDIIVDEASYVPEKLITEIAMPMLATTNGTLTLIGTPCGMNHFWRWFKLGEELRAKSEGNGTTNDERRNDEEASPLTLNPSLSIWSKHAPSWESPYVSQEFLQVQKELISERAFRIEYGAEFLDSVGRVFRTEAIEACLVAEDRDSRDVRREGKDECRQDACGPGCKQGCLRSIPEGAPYFIGIDWARYSDYTAVVVLSGNRKGARLVCAERFHGMSWPDLVEGVAGICERYSECLAMCDATGIGDAVEGMLRKRLPWLTMKSKKFSSTFKGELAEGIAWMQENGRLKMRPHPELIRELQHFEAYPSSMEGRWKYGAPEGFHDDLVIALGLACEVLPSSEEVGIHVGKARSFDFAQDDRGQGEWRRGDVESGDVGVRFGGSSLHSDSLRMTE